MSRSLLYISGPYTGNNTHSTEENIKIAKEYALLAWKNGWAAVTPHLNTAGFEELTDMLTHADWVDGYLAILSRLDPNHDAVLMLPRWNESKGAVLELRTALERGIRVFYAIDFYMDVPDPAQFERKP